MAAARIAFIAAFSPDTRLATLPASCDVRSLGNARDSRAGPRAEECASRPFSAPEWTSRAARIMREMLLRLRGQAGRWPTDGTGFLLCEPDLDGHRHWIRVPDCAALLGARRLTVVGFFGRARVDVDQSPIHRLEAGIVDTLQT